MRENKNPISYIYTDPSIDSDLDALSFIRPGPQLAKL